MQAGIRKYLVEVFLAQIKALLDWQDDSGLWHTVLNESDSYLEVSGSASIAAGIYKGIHMGWYRTECICRDSDWHGFGLL